MRLHPVTVELDFVNPVGAFRRCAHELRELRLNKIRHRCGAVRLLFGSDFMYALALPAATRRGIAMSHLKIPNTPFPAYGRWTRGTRLGLSRSLTCVNPGRISLGYHESDAVFHPFAQHFSPEIGWSVSGLSLIEPVSCSMLDSGSNACVGYHSNCRPAFDGRRCRRCCIWRDHQQENGDGTKRG